MSLIPTARLAQGCLLAMTALCGLRAVAPVQAQESRGFEYVARVVASAEDRRRQPDLWMLEVHYKTLRMISVEVTNPVNGEKSLERIWYLPYKVINRPLTQLDSDRETEPVNDFDQPPTPPIFVPEITLVTTDGDEQQVHADAIVPEAQAVINKRERQQFRNSVQLTGGIPPLSRDATGEEHAVYGVAMWRGISPDTDYFTLIFAGFSNGYITKPGPDGDLVVHRKTLVQNYWRPGDRFDEFEQEVRIQGDPQWIDRPDDSILDPSVLPAADAAAE